MDGPVSFIEIAPSAQGLATVHDRDILIYCISHLMASLNDGQAIAPVVRFNAHDLLRATNWVTSGKGYAALKAALERLRGTQITTNIITQRIDRYNTSPCKVVNRGRWPRFVIHMFSRGRKGRPFVVTANGRPYRPFGYGGHSSRADGPGYLNGWALVPNRCNSSNKNASQRCLSGLKQSCGSPSQGVALG